MELSRFQEFYKSRGRFMTLSDRASLSKRVSATRQTSRDSLIMARRNIPNYVPSPIVMPSKTSNLHNNHKKNMEIDVPIGKNGRKEKLMKWLEKRKQRDEKDKQKKKKPIFKVTHVTHTEDLTQVYKQIKGKLVPNKRTKQPGTIAPSDGYKFKSPTGIKLLKFKRAAGAGKKKHQKLKEKMISESKQPAMIVSKHKPAILRSQTKCTHGSPQPSTSGVAENRKMANKERTQIPLSSSEND